jgi:hypothetical protein
VCPNLGEFQNNVGKGQALFDVLYTLARLMRRLGILVKKLISIERKKKKFTAEKI